jgi:hypothetical protein
MSNGKVFLIFDNHGGPSIVELGSIGDAISLLRNRTVVRSLCIPETFAQSVHQSIRKS